MPPGRHRPLCLRAVLGVLTGLVLLLGAVLDGGLSTPTRVELREPSAAEASVDRSAPAPTAARDEGTAWDRASTVDRLAVPRLPGPARRWVGVATAGALLVAIAVACGAGGRDPADRDARRRGPPLTT